MRRKIEVSPGDRYGRLTVIEEAPPIQWRKYKKRMVHCICDCGKTTTVRLEYLRSGHTKSCGCKSVDTLVSHRKTHGLTGTRLYRIWAGMLNRCRNKNVKSYKHYGAKGVRVCKEWHKFEPFYNWAIKNGYRSDLTIDRVDPYGNYEPSNCRWIPKGEQARNRRNNAGGSHD